MYENLDIVGAYALQAGSKQSETQIFWRNFDNLLSAILKGQLFFISEDGHVTIFYMDIGLPIALLPINPRFLKFIERTRKHFESRGNSVQKIHLKEMTDSIEIVCSTMMGLTIKRIIAHPDNPKLNNSLIVEFGKHFTGKPIHSIQTLFFQIMLNFGKLITVFRSDKYLKRKGALASKLRAALGKNGVLLYPTFHRTAIQHNTSFFHMAGSILSGIFNIIEFPAVHIPMGMDEDGLPIGFQVVASPYMDKNCFVVAQELEKLFGGWVPPS